MILMQSGCSSIGPQIGSLIICYVQRNVLHDVKGRNQKSYKIPCNQFVANKLYISIRHHECSQIMTLEKKSA